MVMKFSDPRTEAGFQKFAALKHEIERVATEVVKDYIGTHPELMSERPGHIDTNQVMALCTGLVEAAVTIAGKAARQVDINELEFVKNVVGSYVDVCIATLAETDRAGKSEH